jgi:hypothetical protein
LDETIAYMSAIEVHWQFVSPGDREVIVKPPYGEELIEEGDDVFMRHPQAASTDAALSRAGVLLQGVCRGTPVDPSSIRLSLGDGWSAAS